MGGELHNMVESKPLSALKNFSNKIKSGFGGKARPAKEKIKSIKSMQKKKDLLLTTFYMNDFAEGGVNANRSRANRHRCMLYPEDKPKMKWDLFMIL